MKNNTNAKTNTALRAAKQAIAANINDDSTVTVTGLNTAAAYDAIKETACEEYKVGRDATYKAIAYAYIWYTLAAQDKAYIDREFEKLSSTSAIYMYRNTVICCFKVDVDAQAATITKYAQVMKYIENNIDFELDAC